MVKWCTCLITDKSATSKDGNILKSWLSVISEWGSFNCTYFKVIFESVKDKSSQELSFNILGDDQEGFLFLISELKEGKDLSQSSEFLLDIEDVAVLILYFLLLIVGEEVGWDVSSIEAESIDVLYFMIKCFSFFDCDYAVVAHFFI